MFFSSSVALCSDAGIYMCSYLCFRLFTPFDPWATSSYLQLIANSEHDEQLGLCPSHYTMEVSLGVSIRLLAETDSWFFLPARGTCQRHSTWAGRRDVRLWLMAPWILHLQQRKGRWCGPGTIQLSSDRWKSNRYSCYSKSCITKEMLYILCRLDDRRTPLCGAPRSPPHHPSTSLSDFFASSSSPQCILSSSWENGF